MRPWKEARDELCLLIKEVSDWHGGDDIEWLRDYAREVVAQNKDDLARALDCFARLSGEYVLRRTQGGDYEVARGRAERGPRARAVSVLVEKPRDQVLCHTERWKKRAYRGR